jgi:hypothetical protein
VSRLRTKVLIGVVVLTVLAIHIDITYTDGLDLKQYCLNDLGGEKLVMSYFSIFGWRCQKASGQLIKFDYDEVCQVQKQIRFAISMHPNDPNSLKCSQIRTSFRPTYIIPAAGAGLNLGTFCEYFLHAGKAILVYDSKDGWRCVDKTGTQMSIDLAAACAWQYWWIHTTPVNASGDPNQWFCQPLLTEL